VLFDPLHKTHPDGIAEIAPDHIIIPPEGKAPPPDRLFNSDVVAVKPSSLFNSVTDAVTVEPPIFNAVKSGLIAVVPSNKLSTLSKLVFIFVPQVSSDAPISGLTKLYVVVVVSAIIQSPI
jgi:hypothetical protein